MYNVLKYTKGEIILSVIVYVVIVVSAVVWLVSDDILWFIIAVIMTGSLSDIRIGRLERYVQELTNRRS